MTVEYRQSRGLEEVFLRLALWEDEAWKKGPDVDPRPLVAKLDVEALCDLMSDSGGPLVLQILQLEIMVRGGAIEGWSIFRYRRRTGLDQPAYDGVRFLALCPRGGMETTFERPAT